MKVQKPSIITHTGVLYTTSSDDGALKKLTEIEAPLEQFFHPNKTKNSKKNLANFFFSLLKVKIYTTFLSVLLFSPTCS